MINLGKFNRNFSTKMDNAKKYNNTKLAISISKGLVSFIILFLFVSFGYSYKLEKFIELYISNDYLRLIAFTLILGIASSILFFPVDYFSEFYLEHKFNLSNQSFGRWIWENLKEALLGAAIGLPLLIIFYFILKTYNNYWWLPFGIIMFLFSVLLAQIFPVFILPLFYKITAIDNEDLKKRIIELGKEANLKIENVFKFDMSKNTKKANAAFAGLGKTKRILLGDTLLNNFSNDEIETVIAHEMGHYKKKHIVKNIIMSTILSFSTFYLIAKLYESTIKLFGFNSILEIPALPVLVLWGSIIGLILTPLSNYISRKFEYEADEYAVKATNKKEIFINTLNKLTEQNLGDKEPHPLIEWFFYSHPSIKNRIAALRKLN